MRAGSVVLAPLPQADGQSKNRPALVLCRMPPFDDLLVCGISTQLHVAVVDFDEVLAPTEPDFAQSGLTTASLIRLGFVSTLPLAGVKGAIGSIAPQRHRRLLEKLAHFLTQPTP